jgi:hypothetical protein
MDTKVDLSDNVSARRLSAYLLAGIISVTQLSPANLDTLLVAHAAIAGAAYTGEWTPNEAKRMAEAILRKALKPAPGMRVQDAARAFLQPPVKTAEAKPVPEPPEVLQEREALVARTEAAKLRTPATSVSMPPFSNGVFVIRENALLPKSAANVPLAFLQKLMDHVSSPTWRGLGKGILLRLQSASDMSVMQFFRWYDSTEPSSEQGDVIELGSEAFAMFSELKDPHTGSTRRSTRVIVKVYENLAPVTSIVFTVPQGSSDSLHEDIESWIHDRPAICIGEQVVTGVVVKEVRVGEEQVAVAALPIDDMVPYEIVPRVEATQQCIQCRIYTATVQEEYRPEWAFCGLACQEALHMRLIN